MFVEAFWNEWYDEKDTPPLGRSHINEHAPPLMMIAFMHA